MAGPEEILRDYPVFRVASMINPGDDAIRIQDYRCKDVTELYAFIRRILNVHKLENLYFLEVHELRKDGKVAIIREGNIPWPKVQTKQTNCIIGPLRKKPDPDPVPKETAAAVVVGKLIEKIKDTPVITEQSRPLKTYELKVA